MEGQLNLKEYAGGYGSEFDDQEVSSKRSWLSDELSKKHIPQRHRGSAPSKDTYVQQYEREERKSHMFHFLSLDAFSRHKKLINDYLKYYGGKLEDFRRDCSRDKTDADVLREHHRFIWDEEGDQDLSWEKTLAKKYYDKLFKEYCISDLSRYKENKIALRWRIEKEVLDGKGQFVCGSKKCDTSEGLKSWEVNFSYLEEGTKKNALVKLRLCPDCSYKLNYHHKKPLAKKKWRKEEGAAPKRKMSKKERKRKKKWKKKEGQNSSSEDAKSEDEDDSVKREELNKPAGEEESGKTGHNIWEEPAKEVVEKSRDEEIEEYLEDLFM